MEQHDLLGHLVRCLEKLRIPYFITGAVASIAYGEPRLTNDIDIVAEINDGHIAGLRDCFPEQEFYLDLDAIRFCLSGGCDHKKNGVLHSGGIRKTHPGYPGDA